MLSAKELLLSVGQKVSATILGTKYDILILGWKEQSFILTDIPSSKGGTFRTAAGTGIHIRFIKEGHTISFTSNVIVTHVHNPSYMLIELPLALEKENMRKHERYKSKFPIVYATGTEPLNEGTIYDVSLGGALINHVVTLAKGDSVFITMNIKALNLNLEKLEAKVQNVRGFSKGSKEVRVSGVMFENISKGNIESLQKIIEIQSMGAKPC